MIIEDFNYHKPQSIEEACKLLEQSENGAVIAGGTDILVEIKQGLRHHKDIVSLSELKDLKRIQEDNDKLIIGAGVTHNDLSKSDLIKKYFPALTEAASNIGTEQIRNTGTIGGNLCTGASCCDMAPALFALNASVEIASHNKQRNILLKDFFVFHKETTLANGELMTKVIVPKPEQNTGSSFEKFGLRETASISVASAAARIKMDNEVCTDACIVVGAVAPTPIESEKASKILVGAKVSELSNSSEILEKAGSCAAEDSIPIDDIRGSAEYRRNIIKVLTKRAVIRAVGRVVSNNY